MRRLPSRRGAFTLVETLVAFPAVEGTVKKGYDTRYASSLKTLSAAVLAYGADNNGLFSNPCHHTFSPGNRRVEGRPPGADLGTEKPVCLFPVKPSIMLIHHQKR
jgi:hypothetical protein